MAVKQERVECIVCTLYHKSGTYPFCCMKMLFIIAILRFGWTSEGGFFLGVFFFGLFMVHLGLEFHCCLFFRLQAQRLGAHDWGAARVRPSPGCRACDMRIIHAHTNEQETFDQQSFDGTDGKV